MNGSSQQKFRELYSSPKPVMKMNLYNSFTARINIPNQYKKRGRAMTLNTFDTNWCLTFQ